MNKYLTLTCVVALLIVCMFLGSKVKSANDEAYALSNKVEELENSHNILQSQITEKEDIIISIRAKNATLRDIISSIQQDNNHEAGIVDLPIQEDTQMNALFDTNPIDSYFIEKSQNIVPTTTIEMVQYELIYGSAWEAEMENCYEILKDRTKNELVRQWLDNDKHSYVEYIKNHAEVAILFGASNAFDGDDENLSVGSIISLLRASTLSKGYQEKTMELFNYLYEIGITPQFIFFEDKYDEEIRQTFPDLWEKAFGMTPPSNQDAANGR